jgi:hypothetical protein
MSEIDDWRKALRQVSAQGRRLGQMIGAAKPGERDVRLLMEADRLLAVVTEFSKLSPRKLAPHDGRRP